MAKGPTKKATKKAAKKPVRPVGKVSAKPAAKAKIPTPKPKARETMKPQAPVKLAPRQPTPQAPPPPLPISAIKAPAAEAVTGFERGMAALQRHDYKTAATILQALLVQFPAEGFLTDRVRVYLELTARELRRQPAGGGSVEERLTSATLALNNHDDSKAAQLAADVLKEDGTQDLAAYLLAVVASRRGEVEAALAHLRNAIAINPECRLQARQDEEFDPLMDSDEFHTLIEAPSSATALAATPQGRKPVRKTGR